MSLRWFIQSFSLLALLPSLAIAAPAGLPMNAPVVSSVSEDAVQEEKRLPPFYNVWDKEGWYWNKVKPDEKKKDDKELKKAFIPPALTAYPYEKLWNMHPDAFQELLMSYQKKAVMQPSEDNVHDYYVMQDIARKKSLAFTNVAMMVWQKNPDLFVLKDYPNNNLGSASMVRQKNANIDGKIRQNKDNFALIYFFSPTCDYCTQQSQMLKHFEDKYQWTIKSIDVSKYPGVAERFGASSVPMIIMVYRNTQDYMPVTTGVATLNEIEENLYRGIRLMNGEITPEQYSLFDFQQGKSFDPSSSYPADRQRTDTAAEISGGRLQ